MATHPKKQPRQRKVFVTDEQTHADVTAYADSIRKDTKVVISELVYSHPRMQRFLNKSTQPADKPENHSHTNL